MEEKEINSEEKKVESVDSNDTSTIQEEMKIEDMPENGETRSVQEEIDIVNKNKLNQALNKISELEDKLIRKDAEMVNYRKRKEEEVNKMLKFCNEDMIKELLPIIDNFERAIAGEPADISEAEKNYRSGVKMIYTHLVNMLEKFDVKAIDSCDVDFDPVYHNAIMLEKREGVKPSIVVEVLQKGYMLKDKVIRAAMVKVSE